MFYTYRMDTVLITFSPTGGTYKCAKYLARGIGEIKAHIDLSDRSKSFDIEIDSNIMAIFALPAYGGRIPKGSAERLKSIKGNNTDATIVAVYGNREIDDTLLEIYDIIKDNGFKVKAAVSAVAEHSLVRKYGAMRPDAIDKEELRSFGERIASSNSYLETIPGNYPYKTFNGCPARPITDIDKCANCSLCFSKCPVEAISENDYSSIDDSLCISCMRCVSICPMDAKDIDATIYNNIDSMLSKVASERKNNALYL